MTIRLELLDASARVAFPINGILNTTDQRIVLIDDAVANTVMVAEQTYIFEANPPDPALLYWVVTIFQPAPSAASRVKFIRRMCEELIARGAGDKPCRWRFLIPSPVLEARVTLLLQPRLEPDNTYELTPNEGLARLPS